MQSSHSHFLLRSAFDVVGHAVVGEGSSVAASADAVLERAVAYLDGREQVLKHRHLAFRSGETPTVRVHYISIGYGKGTVYRGGAGSGRTVRTDNL